MRDLLELTDLTLLAGSNPWGDEGTRFVAQGVGGLGFRHGHQGHVGGITSCRTAGARHAMPYVSQSGMGVHKRLAGVVAAG